MRGFSTMAAALVLAGPVFGQDLECENPKTQLDLTFCARQDWQEADDALNDMYQSALALIEETDAIVGAEDRGAEDALKDAQRLWAKYRDAACLAEAYAYAGGSIQPMIEWNCMARLTWARVEDLTILTDQGN